LVIEAKTQLRGLYERLAKARRQRPKGGVERSPEGISTASLSKILGGDASKERKRPREEDGMTTPIAKRMNTVAKKSAPSRLSPQQSKAVTPPQSTLRVNRETQQQLPSPSPSPAKPCANTDHDPSIMEIVSNFPRHLLILLAEMVKSNRGQSDAEYKKLQEQLEAERADRLRREETWQREKEMLERDREQAEAESAKYMGLYADLETKLEGVRKDVGRLKRSHKEALGKAEGRCEEEKARCERLKDLMRDALAKTLEQA